MDKVDLVDIPLFGDESIPVCVCKHIHCAIIACEVSIGQIPQGCLILELLTYHGDQTL